jgi:hypothetical protein
MKNFTFKISSFMKDVIMTDNEIECNLTNNKNIIGGKVMSKHFLAVMLLVFIAVGTYSQSIPSGEGRMEALANSPFILDASTDMMWNPAWSGYYRHYAFGNIGRNAVGDFELSDQYGGVNFGVSKKLSLGMIINHRMDGYNNMNQDAWGPSALRVPDPIVPFMGLVGLQVSKNFHLGLAPYVAMSKREVTSSSAQITDTTLKGSSLGANIGFGYMIKKGWVEGAIMFRMNKYSAEYVDSASTTTIESEGGMEIGARFRAWIYPTKGSKVAVVPLLSFYNMSYNPKLTSGSTTTTGVKYSWMNIGAGVGLNWPIADDIQIAGGVTLGYNTFKADSGSFTYKATDFIAPEFNMAGETRIADWLTARFGFSRSVDMRKEELTVSSTTGEVSTLSPSSSVQTISLGTGFHFGRFSVDATVSERWLKHGVNFLSGGDNTDMFGVISASYNFAK